MNTIQPKKNVLFVTTLMSLEGVMLSEISQAQEDKYSAAWPHFVSESVKKLNS
jgi:hypothetical protein